jgi:hypothetical protein
VSPTTQMRTRPSTGALQSNVEGFTTRVLHILVWFPLLRIILGDAAIDPRSAELDL